MFRLMPVISPDRQRRFLTRWGFVHAASWFVLLVAGGNQVEASGYFSAQEGKLSLIAGAPVANRDAPPDSIIYLDTSDPAAGAALELTNSVIGPPSNLAHSARSGWLLLADSITVREGEVVPADAVWAIPFATGAFGSPQRIVVGGQPSGIDLDHAGESALVANRRDGTVAALRLDGNRWELAQVLKVGPDSAEPTDVTIAPDGLRAGYVLRQGKAVGFLHRASLSEPWEVTEDPLLVPGLPYRIVFSPDGSRVFTNLADEQGGEGQLQSLERTAAGWQLGPAVGLGYAGPETVEKSPDGRWLVLPMMAGSNLPTDAEDYDPEGRVLIYEVDGAPRLFQTLRCGAIPEGAAFSADALELVVQGHVDRELWIYRRQSLAERFELEERVVTSGHPSALISADDQQP